MIKDENCLNIANISTPLGEMIAIADDSILFMLEFVERKNLDENIQRLQEQFQKELIPAESQPIDSIKKELDSYFKGCLQSFKTPISLKGSIFQLKVWAELRKIPYGQTCSYADLATSIGKPKAFRAVGTANSTNRLAIVVPCHRVINANGKLGGYASGLERKNWLIEHELKSLNPL